MRQSSFLGRDSRPLAPIEPVECRPVELPATTWPLTSHLELAALPTAVPCARKHARAVALEWELPELAESIELVVSELATNAIHAAEYTLGDSLTTPVIGLWLACDRQRVLIQVCDGSSQIPVRADAGPDDERGRGLMLVEHLSSRWGTRRKANGKVVWALMVNDS